MDVYVVDRQYRRVEVVDYYISFIWTERYNAKGDFEMVVASSREARTILKVGMYISIKESDRLMEILEVDDAIDEEGTKTLNIKGYSLEYLLEDRLAFSPGATAAPWWWRTFRTSQSHARNLYREMCYSNIKDTKNHYNDIDVDETPRPGTMPEPEDKVHHENEPMVLYDAIKDTCESADLGFGIFIKNHKEMHTLDRPLVYRVYTGYDRTSTQSVNAPVVFSPDLDNLENTHSLVSSAKFKNVAVVVNEDTVIEVVADGTPSNVGGRSRKVLLVNMKDETELLGDDLIALMEQRGKEELAKHRVLEAFDGEIDEYGSQYVYGRDYGLGDLVEMRNQDGQTNRMMVTEQIFAADAEGQRGYPTLTLFEYVQPGSWLSWDQNRQWVQLTDEEWATMP